MTPETLTYPLPTDRVEVQTIQLTSPLLRIGGAVQSLNPFEYVQSSNRVYIPHADLLARELYQRGKLNEYIDRINRREEIEPLLKTVFGDDWANLKSSDGRSIFPIQLQKWTNDCIRDLRPMIRNSMGQLYIPGSSIKGAIRTAITYYLVKHGHECKISTPVAQQPSELENKIRERMQEHDFKKNKKKQIELDDQILINPLFTDYRLTYENRQIEVERGANTDFMRSIKISDSTPLFPQTTDKTRQDNVGIAAAVTVSSHLEDNKAKRRATIHAEMVRNANATFTIRLDREFLSWFEHQQGMKLPFNSIADVINICQEFAQDIWDEERSYWNSINNNTRDNHQLDFDNLRILYKQETCPYKLRLGWGIGMTGTTIALALSEKIRQEIRDACGLAAPGFNAPKSRRTVSNSNNAKTKYALGWTKLELINK
jgi:CRISPR-associated protein Csm5